jgi:hypothetical protein
MSLANDWVSASIIVVIGAAFAGDAVHRWWLSNAWKRQLNRLSED